MGEKQVIAVVGATGMQGGGLVRAILANPASGLTVRALTRDVHSDKAKELARLGAEVVAADVHDVESLKRAFRVPPVRFASRFSGRICLPKRSTPRPKPWPKPPRQRGCGM